MLLESNGDLANNCTDTNMEKFKKNRFLFLSHCLTHTHTLLKYSF